MFGHREKNLRIVFEIVLAYIELKPKWFQLLEAPTWSSIFRTRKDLEGVIMMVVYRV